MISRMFMLLAVMLVPLCGAEPEHVVVRHDAREFAGWPANEGMWSWGDEILVSYNVADFEEKETKHSFTGRQRVGFSRSMDGGRTWQPEDHANVVVPASVKDVAAPPDDVDFTLPDFVMKIRGRCYYVSKDRGRSWQGPFALPEMGQRTDARTSYVVTGKASCVFFIPCRIDDGRGGRIRSCVAGTDDGLKTMKFLSWIVPDPLDLAEPGTLPKGDDMSGTMPSAVRLEDGRLICAIRNRIKSRKWSSIHESVDGGKTWVQIAELEKGATNPVALVALGDGGLAAIYGNRRTSPFGISAKTSRDSGKTWSKEITLRADGRKWDLGYPRAILRPDGAVVATYYHSTEERPQQHIEATLWKP